MQNKRKQWLSLILGLILFNACSYSYVPHVVNTPLFTEQGELQLALHASTGTDLQLAYSFSDHWGLMANASYADFSKKEKKHQFHSGELGLGYFNSFDQKGMWEIYAGAGRGKYFFDRTSKLDDPFVDFTRTRLFIQPALGTKSDQFEGSLAARFSWVQLQEDHRKAQGLFFEPAMTAKIGNPNIRLVFQLGASLPAREDKLKFDYEILFLSFGLQAKFHPVKKADPAAGAGK